MWKSILIGLAALPLLAQEPTADDLKDLALTLDQPVQAASKRSQRLKEAPADVTVLRGQDLLDLGYRTLGDALGGVLGFQTQEDRAYQGVAIRGLYVLGDQNTRALILLDGHPLNSAVEVGSSKVGEDFGIPLDQVERIEVIRGPASSLYGNSAFLGMVNVVTRDPAPGRAGGEVQASASTRGLGELDGTLGGALGATSWQAMVSGMRRNGTATDFPELQQPAFPADLDREDRQSAYLRARGAAWSLAAYAMDRTQRLASAPFSSTPGSPDNRYTNQIAFGDLRFTPTLGPVETLVRVYGDRNVFKSAFDYDGIRLPGIQGAFAETDPNWSLGLEVQGRARFGSSLLVTLGGEQNWQHYSGVATQGGDEVLTQVRHRAGNFYAQAEWAPVDFLTAIAGVQDAVWTVAQAQSVIDGQRQSYPASTLQGVTPRLGLILQPGSMDILKFLYGGGFRNPTIFEAYYSDVGSFRANTDLRPERITTLQAIWVRVWRTGLQTQLSASRSRWTNLVQHVDLADGFQRSENMPGAIQGSSLEAEIQGHRGEWLFYGQAGFYRWEQGGLPMPDAVHAQGALRVIRHWGDWSASAEVRQMGGREGYPGVRGTPASTVLRGSLRWQGPRFWLRGVLEDAGQARRTDLVATDYAPITRMPADGRTFLLTLGVPF